MTDLIARLESAEGPSRELDIAHLESPQHVILDLMARRLDRYNSTGQAPFRRAKKMCDTCPFRGARDLAYEKEAALVPAQDWVCHTDEDRHCAGHFAVQKRLGKPTPDVIRLAALRAKGVE